MVAGCLAGTAVELEIQRRATERFIASDPTTINLGFKVSIMSAGTKSFGTGGLRGDQIFKIIWSGSDGIVEEPPNGTRKFDFVLLGKHDAVVAINDFWKVGNQEFRIDFVYPYNGWEVKAGGFSHGPGPA